jgi:hypothetical protein
MPIKDINITGYVFQDDGDALAGATVELLETGTTTVEATYNSGTGTTAAGLWTFTETDIDTTYDVKITSGTSIRKRMWADEITLKTVDVTQVKIRGGASAAAPLYFFADRSDDAGDAWRIQASASNTLAIGSDKASQGTIIDYITITNGANAAASTVAVGGALTAVTVDATTDFTVGSLVITDDSIVMTPTSSDTVTIAGATNGALSITTVDDDAAAANITITADGTVDIDSAGALTLDSGAAINLEPAASSVILLDGVITIDAGVVIPVATAHDAAGTAISISAGATTAATTADIAGGSLTLAGGQGKGSGDGGDIIFKTANAGSSGSSLNSLATALTISDDLSAVFAGTVDATTDFTIGSTIITDGVITDSTGLQLAADVDLANNDLDNVGNAYSAWTDGTINIEKVNGSAQLIIEGYTTATTGGAYLNLVRSKSASANTHAPVIQNDAIGTIAFRGSDGAAFVTGAQIIGWADDTWDDSPTAHRGSRLEFKTVDRDSSALDIRMTIGHNGMVTLSDGTEIDSGIIFDGHQVDYHIGLDDTADTLVIGKGSTLGTTVAMEIDTNLHFGIGASPSATNIFNIDKTSAVASRGLVVQNALTLPAGGGNGEQIRASGSIATPGDAGTYNISTVRIHEPDIDKDGGDTLTTASSLYIVGAPSEAPTGSNYALWVDSGDARFDGEIIHSSVAKAWCRITAPGALVSGSFNVASITDTGVGNRTIVWDTDFADVNYTVNTSAAAGVYQFYPMDSQATGSIRLTTYSDDGPALEDGATSSVAFGEQ